MTRYILDAEYIPRRWYNIVPDLPEKLAPPLNLATMEPLTLSTAKAGRFLLLRLSSVGCSQPF